MRLHGLFRPARVSILCLLLALTACGGGGGGGSTPPGGNPPPNNQPPVADAALPESESIKMGETVTLSAAASSDPDGAIASVSWEQVDGPAIDITDPTAVDLVFTAPAVEADGELVLRLTVTDDEGDTSSLEITLPLHATIEGNENPLADAGADAQLSAGAGVTLNGAASSDTDGQVVAYAWTQLAGPAVELAGADTANPSFIAPDVEAETALKFRLVVTDDDGTTHSDVVTVTLAPHTGGNRAPFIGEIAGIPTEAVAEGGNLTLTASASDPDEGDELTFSWELIEPEGLAFEGVTFPVSGAELALTLPDVTEDTAVTLRLTVTDGNLTATQDLDVTIGFENQAPTVSITTEPDNLLEAGINEGQAFTLTANPVDPDGKAGFTYTWTQTAGNVDLDGELANVTGPELTLTAPNVATDQPYGFTVTVTDADGAKVTSEEILFSVNFQNQAPIANAGADTGGDENTEITLNGQSSLDPDGEAISYAWTQTAGEAQATFVSGNDVANPTIRLPDIDSAEAMLTFSLVVTDLHGVPSAAATVNVTVNNVNRAPVIGGIDGLGEIDESSNLEFIGFIATGVSDPDGDNLNYQWTLPAGFVARNGTASATLDLERTPDISPAQDGDEHTFTLRVTDDGAPAAFTEATHTVTLNFVNQVPQLTLADITGDTTVTEGGDVRLAAAARDGDLVNGDEQDLAYTWRLVDDGGLAGLPDNVTHAELAFTAPEVEDSNVTVTYRVVASDGLADSAPPLDIMLTIEPDQAPPVITAPAVLDVDEGTGISFTLSPTVSDNKTAVDELDYDWTVPNGFSIQAGTDQLRELVITDTPDVGPEGGSGIFGFTVTDADGNSESVDFEVTVNFVNQAPAISGVSGSRTVNENVAGATLTATGDDPDGQGFTFRWTRAADGSGISDAELGLTGANALPFEGETLTYNTPDIGEDDVAIGFVVVAVDELDRESEPMPVEVTISADPAPVIDAIDPDPVVVDEGSSLNQVITVTASDETSIPGGTAPTDPTQLRYEWSVPEGLAVTGADDGDNQVAITGTPDVGPAGDDLTLTVAVIDPDENRVERDINVRVNFLNETPVINGLVVTDGEGNPIGAVDEGETALVFTADASDGDADEGQAVEYEWIVPAGFQVSGGVNNSALSVIGTPNVIQDSGFTFTVRVDDGVAEPVERSIDVTVNFLNQRPEANAGGIVSITETAGLPNATAILDASASRDADIEENAPQTLTYTWTYGTASGLVLEGAQDNGGASTVETVSPVINIVDLPDVTADTEIPVTLVVNDGSGATNAASQPVTTTVRVLFENQDPVINSASALPISPDEGETVVLSADVDDPDGQVPGLVWSQVIEGDETPVEITQNGDGTASFTAPNVGPDNTTLHFVVTADDGAGGVVDNSAAPLNVPVFFVNENPVIESATASANPAPEGTEVTLTGIASDPDGQDLALSWAQVEGDEQAVTITNNPDGTATFIAPDVTATDNLVLDFAFTADDGTDGVVESGPVSVAIEFVNQPPTAPITDVNPENPNEGDTVTLFAVSNDPDNGGAVTYEWTQSPDDPVQVALTDNGALGNTFVAPDVQANDNLVLNFEVVARDADHVEHGNGESEPVLVAVPVAFVNQAPVIDALTAEPQSVTPGGQITLQVNASDADGQNLGYLWSQDENGAPNAGPITDLPNGQAIVVAPQLTSTDGATLVFRVMVDDGSGEANATASDTVSVNVVFENTAPVINSVVATPQSVDEGVEFSLIADVTDDDQELGQELTYTWAQRSGETPSVGVITSNPDGSATIMAPEVDVETDLHFTVTVNDGVAGEVTSNEVTVTVADVPIQVDPFAFTDLTHAAPGLTHGSNAIVVDGLPDGVEVPVSIEGGEYAVDGGAFTSTDGTLVANGSSIVVKVNAPTTGGGTTSATLTLGEGADTVSDSFDITAADSELTLSTSFRAVNIGWSEMQGADRFELWYQPTSGAGFSRVLDNISGGETSVVDNGLYLAHLAGQEPKGLAVHLTDWEPSYDQYRLVACNEFTPCQTVPGHEKRLVQPDSVEAVGYFGNGGSQQNYSKSIDVSNDGNVIVVGASTAAVYDPDFGVREEAGRVFIYRLDADATWVLHQSKGNIDGKRNFGESVAVNADGQVIAIGQPHDSIATAGDLRVLEWSDSSQRWEESEFDFFGVCSGSEIGRSVDISDDGTVIAVGAPRARPASSCTDAATSFGIVHIFRKVDGVWELAFSESVGSETPVNGEEFGSDVELSADGNRLFVTTAAAAGDVEVFAYNGSDWTSEGVVSINRPNGRVSVSDDGLSFVSGGAIYRRTGGEWQLESDLVDILLAAGVSDFTPTDVALDATATTAVISNIADSTLSSGVFSAPVMGAGAPTSGAAYVFGNDGSGWNVRRYVKASNTDADDAFGSSIAIGDGGTILVVGAPGEDSSASGVDPETGQNDNSRQNSGAVYVY